MKGRPPPPGEREAPPLKTVLVLVALVLAAPLAPLAAGAPPAAPCVEGDAEAAARALVHPGARVEREDEVAGFASARVVAPLVHPGTTFRLVQAGGLWCAAEGLAEAWRLDGRARDDVAVASAFAQLAGAPWMEDVHVRRAQPLAAGVVQVETHAPVNGILATWTVILRGARIVEARFVSTAIGVDAASHRIDGLVAIPGGERAWRLEETGLLVPTQAIVPELPRPTITPVDSMSDGFRVQYSLGGGVNSCPDPGVELGVQMLDACSLTRRLVRENYEEFLRWGLKKGWSSNFGTVYVDDSTALLCFACVVISTRFQIHIHTAVIPYLAASGYTYESDEEAYSNILGHEMVHNFQNAYSRPSSGVYMEGAYSEGIARFQETLHDYSWVSHQPGSLVYAADANGCNDETGTPSRPFEFPDASPIQWANGPQDLASGPSTGQSYSACHFWMSWYGTHGVAGLRRIFEASATTRTLAGWDEVKTTVELATGAPIDDDLARFARALLTGDGLAWGPAAGTGPVFDWGEHLARWTPVTLAPGGSATATLRDGGMMAARLATEGIVSASGGARLYVVRDAGGESTVAAVPSGASVPVAPGEDVWVVAIRPEVGSASVTLAVA